MHVHALMGLSWLGLRRRPRGIPAASGVVLSLPPPVRRETCRPLRRTPTRWTIRGPGSYDERTGLHSRLWQRGFLLSAMQRSRKKLAASWRRRRRRQRDTTSPHIVFTQHHVSFRHSSHYAHARQSTQCGLLCCTSASASARNSGTPNDTPAAIVCPCSLCSVGKTMALQIGPRAVGTCYSSAQDRKASLRAHNSLLHLSNTPRFRMLHRRLAQRSPSARFGVTSGGERAIPSIPHAAGPRTGYAACTIEGLSRHLPIATPPLPCRATRRRR
ncbi:uncharacterized protein K460DRAFT_7156 [Cucurbitaria berberidis CBS 394.84]|uniref:Uncharacterized protein n=1 Tax=Cucurbitaria berberidis CBS 394.84 TaxID=1168544 RepID=A0A9P4GRD6_9PLEO|nr:uncharacterized protein K460DRAFT_7156 [Cucurbitaria berberidis CBS 394.84]KAF1849942.1 hypothetical protein K460DRAFT_7156 [Cucurbitaria berberidis CBS 394.84]